jgi:hypothetical protein
VSYFISLKLKKKKDSFAPLTSISEVLKKAKIAIQKFKSDVDGD